MCMFERALTMYERVLRCLVAALVAGIVAATTWQILGRALNRSPLWTSEVVTILLVWLTFLGAALATRLGGHIHVDTFVNKLPSKVQFWVRTTGLGLVIVFLVIVFLAGVPHAISSSSISTPILGISNSVMAAGPAVGALAILPFAIDDVFKLFSERESKS